MIADIIRVNNILNNILIKEYNKYKEIQEEQNRKPLPMSTWIYFKCNEGTES